MKKLQKILKNKNGEMYIRTVFALFFIMMLLAVVLFFTMTLSKVSSTKLNTQRMLDAYLVEHTTNNIYTSLINADNKISDSEIQKAYTQLLSDELGITVGADEIISRYKDNKIRYKMSIPEVTYNEEKLNLTARYVLSIPVFSFFGEEQYFNINMKVISNYKSKFN